MTGAPTWLREQPVLLMPALVQHVRGDVEVAWLLQRVKDHGGLDRAVGVTLPELARILCMSEDQVPPVLQRALDTGLVMQVGPPTPHHTWALRLVVSE